MKNILVKAITTLAIFPALVNAQTSPQRTGLITIAALQTGWSADMIAVFPVEGVTKNPAVCATQDVYIVDATELGFKLHANTLLTAFSLGKKVDLVISGTKCTAARPTIIGLTIHKDQ